jgi:hypothetical protein
VEAAPSANQLGANATTPDSEAEGFCGTIVETISNPAARRCPSRRSLVREGRVWTCRGLCCQPHPADPQLHPGHWPAGRCPGDRTQSSPAKTMLSPFRPGGVSERCCSVLSSRKIAKPSRAGIERDHREVFISDFLSIALRLLPVVSRLVERWAASLEPFRRDPKVLQHVGFPPKSSGVESISRDTASQASVTK